MLIPGLYLFIVNSEWHYRPLHNLVQGLRKIFLKFHVWHFPTRWWCLIVINIATVQRVSDHPLIILITKEIHAFHTRPGDSLWPLELGQIVCACLVKEGTTYLKPCTSVFSISWEPRNISRWAESCKTVSALLAEGWVSRLWQILYSHECQRIFESEANQ